LFCLRDANHCISATSSSPAAPARAPLHSFPTRRSSDLLDFAAALGKVVEKGRKGPLSDELSITLKELKLGKTREEALRNLAELRSEEHTSELQSPYDLVCRLLLEKKNLLLIYIPIEHTT